MGFEVEEVHKEVLLAHFSNPGIQVQVAERGGVTYHCDALRVESNYCIPMS